MEICCSRLTAFFFKFDSWSNFKDGETDVWVNYSRFWPSTLALPTYNAFLTEKL